LINTQTYKSTQAPLIITQAPVFPPKNPEIVFVKRKQQASHRSGHSTPQKPLKNLDIRFKDDWRSDNARHGLAPAVP
jgi:hypothetical protein